MKAEHEMPGCLLHQAAWTKMHSRRENCGDLMFAGEIFRHPRNLRQDKSTDLIIYTILIISYYILLIYCILLSIYSNQITTLAGNIAHRLSLGYPHFHIFLHHAGQMPFICCKYVWTHVHTIFRRINSHQFPL